MLTYHYSKHILNLELEAMWVSLILLWFRLVVGNNWYLDHFHNSYFFGKQTKKLLICLRHICCNINYIRIFLWKNIYGWNFAAGMSEKVFLHRIWNSIGFGGLKSTDMLKRKKLVEQIMYLHMYIVNTCEWGKNWNTLVSNLKKYCVYLY